MSFQEAPKNRIVWITEDRCKGCDICVGVCPAGVLSMAFDETSPIGSVAKVVFEDSCIGCNECELHCPDFAIFVANKKHDHISFAKLTEESQKRAKEIKENKYHLTSEHEKQANIKESINVNQ